MTKTEACWDRTEGCCMTDAARLPKPAPTCTCHPVPEQYHTTHYGATEPGSTLEPDYGCAVHFPERKREWGKAPGHVETYVIHHEDGTWVRDRTRWTWYCTGGECGDADESDASNSAVDPLPNWAAAMEGLAEHQRTAHERSGA